jgi:hypothetical protein
MTQDKKREWPEWAALTERSRDGDGTRRLPVVERDALLKESEPATGVLAHEDITRLRAQAQAMAHPALDPLDDELPVVSPVQPAAIKMPSKLPPPAPTEVPPPATELLDPDEIASMRVNDELVHGGRHSLPVLASRLKPSPIALPEAVQGVGYVEDVASQNLPQPVIAQPVIALPRLKSAAAPPVATPHPVAPPQAFAPSFTPQKAPPHTPTQRTEILWMLAAMIFGMALMGLWLGKL